MNERITKTNKRTGKKLLKYSIMMDSFIPCALFFAKYITSNRKIKPVSPVTDINISAKII